MDLTQLTISQIHQGLLKKEFSAEEVCQSYLKKIKEKDSQIKAFITLCEELALSIAKEVDEMILTKKELPVLAGIPFSVKDNILVEGIRCTAGSKILQNYIAPYNATVIKKLRAQKAVILGKTNLDEFAMGSSTENSAFFVTKNPRDESRVPGGSSGGSAASVSANFCLFSLGSDTGGSIRQPASFCGVVGLKPTYGRVSRYGLIAFASSLDQIGPLARTVEECEIVFNVIKGKDEKDATTVALDSEPQFSKEIKKLKIGVPREYFVTGIEREVKEKIDLAIREYEDLGAKIEEISLPHTHYALPCYYIVACSEASSNLARYDGIRYGESADGENVMDVYFNTRKKGFGNEVKRRIMIGTYVLSVGHYEAYYLKAQRIRTLIKEDFQRAFEKVDVIFTPTSPTLPFKIGERIDDPLKMYLSDIFTVSVNLAGLPAISIPLGEVRGLPVGLQIIANVFEEEKIFKVAKLWKGERRH